MLSTLLVYGALFCTSLLAATILPLSSEVALVAAVRSEHALVVPVLVATTGNYVGACVTYWLGWRARQVLQRNDRGSARHERAARLLRRYGPPVLLLSWLPLLGDALVALAGAIALPFASFSCWVAVGKLIRYLVVGWAAYALLA